MTADQLISSAAANE